MPAHGPLKLDSNLHLKFDNLYSMEQGGWYTGIDIV